MGGLSKGCRNLLISSDLQLRAQDPDEPKTMHDHGDLLPSQP